MLEADSLPVRVVCGACMPGCRLRALLPVLAVVRRFAEARELHVRLDEERGEPMNQLGVAIRFIARLGGEGERVVAHVDAADQPGRLARIAEWRNLEVIERREVVARHFHDLALGAADVEPLLPRRRPHSVAHESRARLGRHTASSFCCTGPYPRVIATISLSEPGVSGL